MNNNVISIVVDSVIADYVGTGLCKISPTPFIDSLKKESLSANKMYSPGPFTDAATKSLFTGRDCLEDYSFFFKYSQSPTNHYKVFKERGYETIGIYYPYYITGQKVTNYIDHIYYASGFAFTSEWFGMFSYFADKNKKEKLNDEEILLLQKRIELMFEVWIKFYSDLLSKPDCGIMIDKAIKSFEIKNALKVLENEYNLYQKDKNNYLTAFLREGTNHVLAKLDGIDFEAYIDRDFLGEKVYNRYKKEFNYFERENIKANLKRNRPSFKRFCYAIRKFFKTHSLDEFWFLANYYICLTSFRRMKSKSFHPVWQYEQSSYRHFEMAKTAINRREHDNKPFYLSVHVEEPHNYIACFSYDSQNENMLDDEINMLYSYVKSLNGNFVGNLLYILSIRYVDYQIEKFCKYLKEKGLWDSTTLLICADHGSSFSYYPLHNTQVNCFDNECYHIPMIIRHPGFKGEIFNKYCNSKDILPTLVDIVGLKTDPYFTGNSILNNFEANDYVITEYPGGGCPDVNSKRLWLSIRDNRYVVAYQICINQDLISEKPTVIYDLAKDPMGFYNVNDRIEMSQIMYLINPLNNFFCSIKNRNQKFLSELFLK